MSVWRPICARISSRIGLARMGLPAFLGLRGVSRLVTATASSTRRTELTVLCFLAGAGLAIYRFTGGPAPWEISGMSLSAYLVAALFGTMVVMALSVLCAFLASPKNESAWGELLESLLRYHSR